MSSRALRKALKQRELQEAQAKLTSLGHGSAKPAVTSIIGREGEGGIKKLEDGEEKEKEEAGEEEEEEEEEDEESDEAHFLMPQARPNLFAMLGAGDEDNVEEEDGDESEGEPTSTMSKKPTSTPKSIKKKKNKKNKKKMNADSSSTRPPHRPEDDIDQALRSLKPNPTPITTASKTSPFGGFDQDFLTLLKSDPRNFDASQEMRRLFGRVAVNNNAADDAAGGGATQRGRRGARAGIGAGVQGRGALKRNIFAQPKLSWPNAGSNGLVMVTVKDEVSGDESEFKFVHGTRYQDTQRQFIMCVLAMGMPKPIPWL